MALNQSPESLIRHLVMQLIMLFQCFWCCFVQGFQGNNLSEYHVTLVATLKGQRAELDVCLGSLTASSGVEATCLNSTFVA